MPANQYKDPGYKKKYNQKNREEINKKQREYYQIHKEEAKTYNKKYRQEHGELIREWNKKYREKNKGKISIRKRKYRQKNKEKINKYTKIWRSNPQRKLSNNISNSIRKSLKRAKNGYHWESCVDFTREELMKYLEKQFTQGMTWDNYGKWHIEHRIPISVFNFDNPIDLDFKRCWALSNLRPMWAKENLIKYNKIDKPFQPNLKI